MEKFFVITPLGFEKCTLREMQEVWPYLLGRDAQVHGQAFPQVNVLKGGLEFECDLGLGLQLNFFLKTASRILLRMASFKVRDFPKLYHKMQSLPWREFLPHGQVHWAVSAQHSRLNNEKRLQETAEGALQDVFGKGEGKAEGQDPCATIFLRLDEDLCTISLDSSGEHLHKRGWTILKGEAPLRETIAARLLLEMIEDTPREELHKIRLVDPMMGAGTFLSEARSLQAGQFQRPFAFQKWIRCPKLFRTANFSLNYRHEVKDLFASYEGYDVDPKMIPVAQENFTTMESQLAEVQRKGFHPAKTFFAVQNVFATEARSSAQGSCWLICNPPYGERLHLQFPQEGANSLAEVLSQKFQPQKMGLLLPIGERFKAAPTGYKIQKEVRINNGGLRTLFTVFSAL